MPELVANPYPYIPYSVDRAHEETVALIMKGESLCGPCKDQTLNLKDREMDPRLRQAAEQFKKHRVDADIAATRAREAQRASARAAAAQQEPSPLPPVDEALLVEQYRLFSEHSKILAQATSDFGENDDDTILARKTVDETKATNF